MYRNQRSNTFILSTTFLCIVFLSTVALAQWRDAADQISPSGGWPAIYGPGGGRDVAIQSDHKFVVVGTGCRTNNCNDGSFNIARFHRNGVFDISFGGTGRLTAPFGPSGSVSGVATQTDGKIIVAGTGSNPGGPANLFFFARYLPNGTLDPTFGRGSGKVSAQSPCLSSFADVEVLQNGLIIGLGTSHDVGGVCPVNGSVFRYLSDGTPDTSFATNGKFDTTLNLTSIATQPDGKVVLSSASNMLRLNANGSLDPSFGTAGMVEGGASSLAIQPDGKILFTSGGLGRYNSNGSIDTSFDGDGYMTFYEPWGKASSVAVQPNGKIVVIGTVWTGQEPGGWEEWAYLHLNPDGSTGPYGGYYFGGLEDAPDFPYAVAASAEGFVMVGSMSNKYAISNFLSAPARRSFDFDGDGRSDVSVFRPSDRVWYLNQSTAGFSATQFGLSTDKITPADYDGDGRTDISVYRDGTWYWLNSSDNSFSVRQFGIASDIPVPADYYTGGESSELAIYRNGAWWILNLFNDQVSAIQFGLSTDKPVPADYDGDGRADQAVYRNGEWHVNRSSQGYIATSWGLATDQPVPADYDGDGKTDPAVYRDGTWYALGSLHGWLQFNWGLTGDVAAPADYDGDARADLAVYRDGTWYLLQTTSGASIQQFGLTSDKPIPAAYLAGN